jgi:hypothetical protein
MFTIEKRDASDTSRNEQRRSNLTIIDDEPCPNQQTCGTDTTTSTISNTHTQRLSAPNDEDSTGKVFFSVKGQPIGGAEGEGSIEF